VNNGFLNYAGASAASVTLTFTEADSGIYTITFDPTSFTSIATVNGKNDDDANDGWDFTSNILTLDNPVKNPGSTAITIVGALYDLTTEEDKMVTVSAVKDASGDEKVEDVSSYPVTFDKTAPTISGVTIRGSAATTAGFTNSTIGNILTITGVEANVSRYAVTETNSAPVLESTDWKDTISGDSPWTITGVDIGGSLSQDNTNTRYVWLKDKANNVIASSFTLGSFTGDNTAPTVSTAVLHGPDAKVGSGATKSASGNTLTLNFSETNPSKYALTTTGVITAPDTGWQDWSTATITGVTLPDTTGSARLWLKDKAGNVSAYKDFTYTYNTTAPEIDDIEITSVNNSDYIGNNASAEVSIDFTEVGSGIWTLTFNSTSFTSISKVNGYVSGHATDGWGFAANTLTLNNPVTTSTITIEGQLNAPTIEGSKMVTVSAVKDAAGNEKVEDVSSNTVTFDKNAPSGPGIKIVDTDGSTITDIYTNNMNARGIQITFSETAANGSGLYSANLTLNNITWPPTSGDAKSSVTGYTSGGIPYTWNGATLTFDSGDASMAGELKGSTKTVTIPLTGYTLTEGEATITLTELKDFAGNTTGTINVASNKLVYDNTAPVIAGTLSYGSNTISGITLSEANMPASLPGNYTLTRWLNGNAASTSLTTFAVNTSYPNYKITGANLSTDNDAATYELIVTDRAGNPSAPRYITITRKTGGTYDPPVYESYDGTSPDTTGPVLSGMLSTAASDLEIRGITITDAGIGFPSTTKIPRGDGSNALFFNLEWKDAANGTSGGTFAHSTTTDLFFDSGNNYYLKGYAAVPTAGNTRTYRITVRDRFGNATVKYFGFKNDSGTMTITDLLDADPAGGGTYHSVSASRSFGSFIASGVNAVGNFFSRGSAPAIDAAPAQTRAPGNRNTQMPRTAAAETVNAGTPSAADEYYYQSVYGSGGSAGTSQIPVTVVRVQSEAETPRQTRNRAAPRLPEPNPRAEQSPTVEEAVQAQFPADDAPLAAAPESFQNQEQAAAPSSRLYFLAVLVAAGIGIAAFARSLAKRRKNS
jgi:hypothetical protein